MEEDAMEKQSDVAIGTWPQPEKPHLMQFEERDRALMKELTGVFAKHGLKGSIVRVEFDCGTVPPPRPKGNCFRVCFSGPDDRPYCIWVCV
jgi:hypothetical protein